MIEQQQTKQQILLNPSHIIKQEHLMGYNV